MKKSLSPRQGGPIDRLGFLWLALGTIFSLFAANGRWDLPLAAWLSPLFFLRFTRTRDPLSGFVGVLLASISVMIFFFYESAIFSPILIVAGLIASAILALPYLIDRLVFPRLSLVNGLLMTLVFPLSRAAFEYLISLAPTGSLWSLAYTQYGNLPLLQLLSITGIYGVSFLMAWFASISNRIWEQHFSWPGIRTTTLLYGAVLVLVLLGGSIRLAFFPPSSSTVRVAGISVASSTYQKTRHEISNFTKQEQLIPINRAQMHTALALLDDELLARSQQEARAGAKIIVWPEGGAVTLAEDAAGLIERGKTLAQQERIYLDMGLVVLLPQAPYVQDRAVLIDSQGRIVWTYDKAHPVPGMETFPAGDGRLPVVDTSYGRIANVICFDADFPDLMRQAGSGGVDLMLVPGNDWLEVDPWHTQNATFRAIENGYSLVRQTSHGLAMTVDYQGHVMAATDYFTIDQQTMIAYVPMKGVWTIYALVGDLFAWLCIAGSLMLGAFVLFVPSQRRLQASTPPSQPSSVSAAEQIGIR